MRKDTYLSIKNRLKQLAGPDKLPLIRHFDLWNKQTDFLEQETPFDTPAVFVEFGTVEWHQLGDRMTDADLNVTLHIITRDFMQTADYSPMEMEALEYLDLIDTICGQLHGFAPAHCNRLMRVRSHPNHNHERYVDSMEEFVCRMTWHPAGRPKVMVIASPDVHVIPQIQGSAGCAPTVPVCGSHSPGGRSAPLSRSASSSSSSCCRRG